MADSTPSIRLCPEHICEIFWDEALIDKIDSGEWVESIRRSSTGGEGKAFQPFSDYNGNWIVETQEVIWIEVTTGDERARLHRLITDQNTIGGSGYPDPKRINLGTGRKYALTRTKINEACSKCGRIGHDWPERRRSAVP